MDFTKSIKSASIFLVAVNILTFLIVRVTYLFAGDRALTFLALPSDAHLLLRKIWTPVTYMITQFDFWQLTFNMLWLWWLGSLLINLRSSKSLLITYIAGGLTGAVAYIFYNLANFNPGHLVGSSCSVLAVMTAVTILSPDKPINLLFFGKVKLKWIIAASLTLYAIESGFTQPSASIAHLAGALAGVAAGLSLRRAPRPHRRNSAPSLNADDEFILNNLLDKVRLSGYASLSPAERKLLIEITNRIGK